MSILYSKRILFVLKYVSFYVVDETCTLNEKFFSFIQDALFEFLPFLAQKCFFRLNRKHESTPICGMKYFNVRKFCVKIFANDP